MNDNQPNNNPAPDWRDMRARAREERRAMRDEMRAQRRAWRGDSAWIVGAVLILVGLALTLQNIGAYTFHNWWALFILIPAVGSFGAAWAIFNNGGGQFSPAVVGPFLTGLVLLGITAAFLFELNLNWGIVGPVVLILLGVSALVGALVWRR
jgi:hypothetical protein